MRDFLKALGLEQETIDTIMAEHGKLMTASTEKVTQLTTENAELKKVDGEALKNEIETLKKDKETLTTEKANLTAEHTKEIDSMLFNSALDMAVFNTKTVDPIGFKAHLDLTKLSYNKETKQIDGFGDQETALKQSQAHLFSTQPTGGFQGGLGDNKKDVPLTGALADYYKEN